MKTKKILLPLIIFSALFVPNLFSENSAYVNAQAPIEISTWEELNNVRNDLVADYILMNDLDQNSTGYDTYASSTSNAGAGWQPIGLHPGAAFTGSFDGNGYYIKDVVMNGTGEFYGFFGTVIGGSISNLGLVNLSLTHDTNTFVGGLVGAGNNITISNVYVEGTISSTSGIQVGGLVGSSVLVSGNNTVTILDSSFEGNISGASQVGGLIGASYGLTSIANSYSIGSVIGPGDGGTGGLIGVHYSVTDIDNSYSASNVSGGQNTGGLVGQSLVVHESSIGSLTINDSYSTGSIVGVSAVGGLVGFVGDNLTLTNSYSVGDVNGALSVGGLVGFLPSGLNSPSSISQSYSSGNITGTDNVGGLVGELYGDVIEDSYSEGSVSGENYVGGLVGGMFGLTNISRSYALGGVSGLDQVGGFVGTFSDGLIDNSYSRGVVDGNISVGGFIGQLFSGGEINKSYSTGLVTASSEFGGFVGDNFGLITDSFWDVDNSGLTIGYGVGSSGLAVDQMVLSGLTTEEMKDILSFSGFDIDLSVNNLNDGYPYLSWQISAGGYIWLIFENVEEDDEPTGNQPSRRSAGGITVQGRVTNLISLGEIDQAQELVKRFYTAFGIKDPLNYDRCELISMLVTNNLLLRNKKADEILKSELDSCVLENQEYNIASFNFYRDLEIGLKGEDVRQLQILLNNNGYTVALSGPGSKGNETSFFGELTRQALINLQIESNITPAVGYFGPITRGVVKNKKSN